MTTAHQIVGLGGVLLTAAVLVAALWSAWAGRRTDGRRDHRFAVDRLVLGASAVLAVAGAVGLAILVSGGRPGDPLHLLYAVLAVVALPLGWIHGGRADPRSAPSVRFRRDAWVAVAAVVLLGVELRLLLTG